MSYMDINEETCKSCDKCHERLLIWAIIASLMLSLMKSVIGILGSCESIEADGLYSFYQSYVFVKFIWLSKSTGESSQPKKLSCLYFAGLICGIILSFGLIDVTVFSFIRMVKASKGLLVKPSLFALFVSIISILVNQVLYRYSLCVNSKSAASGKTINKDLINSLRFSMIISSIVLVGVCIARYFSLYADAVATLIIALSMVSSVAVLLKESIRKIKSSVL